MAPAPLVISQRIFHVVLVPKLSLFPIQAQYLLKYSAEEVKQQALIAKIQHSALLNLKSPFIFNLEVQPSLGASSRESYSSFITFEKSRGKNRVGLCLQGMWKTLSKIFFFCLLSLCRLDLERRQLSGKLLVGAQQPHTAGKHAHILENNY